MSDNWLLQSIAWYLTLAAAGWAAAPLVRWLLRRLPDQGASVTKPIGLLLMVWPAWWLASVSPIPYHGALLWLTLLAVGGISWFMLWRRNLNDRHWIRRLLVWEAVTAIAFWLYVGLRGYTPAIVWTEKAMDMAFLSSSFRTNEMPPADPWFSGETINYYYLGYLIHGSVARITDIPTSVAYNLALATTAALVFTGACGAAWNLLRPKFASQASAAGALLAGFFVVVAGNALASKEFLRDPGATIDDNWWGRVGWASSRIVIDNGSSQAETINEFPWFSLLLGDLHPHLTALPFTMMAIALAGGLLLSGSQRFDWPRLALTGGLLGALYPLNSLDFPTYLLLAVCALLLASGLTRLSAKRIAVVVGAALIVWLPFFVRFVPFAGGDETELPDWLEALPVIPRVLTTIRFYTGEHTSLDEFFTVFGVFWLISIALLCLAIGRRVAADGKPRIGWQVAIGAGILFVAAVALPAPVVLLTGLPLIGIGWLLQGAVERNELREIAMLGLVGVAFVLLLGTEFFYVQDSFDGRYNTLFKVYYQVWAMLGIVAAIAVVELWAATRTRPIARVAYAGAVVAILLIALGYPTIATPQWTRAYTQREWQGLDGDEFLGNYAPGTLATIEWLSKNAKEDDVILEAPGCSYQVYGEVPTSGLAAFTGVPTVIGWDFHEVQWRGGQDSLLAQITPRGEEVAAMYADPSSDLFDRYGVTLLFVGEYEMTGAGEICPKAGPYGQVLADGYPGAGWTEVFASGDTRIFRRVVE